MLTVKEQAWQGRTAFLFREDWGGERLKGQPDLEGGLAEAMVAQGDDHWLYTLRMRAIHPQSAAAGASSDPFPPLLREVWETFSFD